MKITQLRNATLIVEFAEHRILLDPMLARQGRLPPLKWLTRERRRNPLVDLPGNARTALAEVTHALITHCQKGHFDHLDRAGLHWLRERQLPVFCMPGDADYLQKRGLNVQVLAAQGVSPFLGGNIRPIPCVHGEGWVGRLMAHGYGYVIEMPDEPSLYLAGDTILSQAVRDCLTQLRPAISVIPAGGAAMDVGQEIIMGEADVLEVLRLNPGIVVANHLEALDHCPVSRQGLLAAAREAGLHGALRIPEDGEVMIFQRDGQALAKAS